MPAPVPGASSFRATLTPKPTAATTTTGIGMDAAAFQNANANLQQTIAHIMANQGNTFDPKQYTIPTYDSKKWQVNTPAKPPQQRQRKTRASTPASATPAPVSNYAQYPQTQTGSRTQPTQKANTSVARAPLPTTPQALTTTYPSRLRTGTTLLMQPILSSTSNTGGALSAARTGSRRGGIVNYAELGSDDDMAEPDAGERENNSEDSDFNTRASVRPGRPRNGFVSYSASPAPQPQNRELDQSYLGQEPPSRYIKPKSAQATRHEYPSQEALENQALKPAALVPVRVEFETETHRIRDCFLWDLNDDLTKPETFARIFCNDLDIPQSLWGETIAAQIRAQIEEYDALATMDLGTGLAGYEETDENDHAQFDVPECRVILSIDVQIATHHLMDHIEWDLLSPLTPEAFAQTLCADIGLTGEAVPLIAHALHEEILKHKKDAIEWGVLGGDPAPISSSAGIAADGKERKETFALKDKGIGLGPGAWSRPPRDGLGRGPRALKSVWKDWNDAEEYATRFEVLTAEEVERRDYERERASRRLRRETSKFQSSTRRRR